MVMPCILAMGAAYTAALLLLVRRLRIPGRGYLPEKTLCSVYFVVVAAVCALLGSRREAFWHLLPALLCCVAGDVVLAVYNRLRRPGWFLAGLAFFLSGHALFVWGLCRLQPLGWPVPLAAVLGMAGALALSLLPGMELGRMRPWVVLYAAFVSALLGKGAQLAFGIGRPWCFLVLAGAALFWVSDLLILFLYFYEKKHPAVHIANLLTYYYAMFLLGASLAF
ncbi:MAG TPA: lysoplasmalogenase [Candidatus Anaerofilum faecale]|nr:lysoplasmalogenase [Candidatus Anaerofilum faecale]